MKLLDVLVGANVALKLIQARLITLVALLMTFGLFAWAMWQETSLAVIIAATWGLTIFLPVLFTGRGGYDAQAPQREPKRPEDEPARGPADTARDTDAD
jgi:hypothetical protein